MMMLRLLAGAAVLVAASPDALLDSRPAYDAPGRYAVRTVPLEPDHTACLNNRGDVAGTVEVRDRGGELVGFQAAVWRSGRLINLGSLPAYPTSSVGAMNDRGEVVGYCELSSSGAITMVEQRAFHWRAGRMKALGALAGFTESVATSINQRGDIAGYSSESPPYLRSEPTRAFLFRNGRMEDLGALGGIESFAHDVNDLGQVVGSSEVRPAPDGGETARMTYHVRARAFLWDQGKMRSLGAIPEKSGSEAVAINNRGQIVGTTGMSDDELPTRAFIWDNGRMRVLQPLKQDHAESEARDINRRGDVVGVSGALSVDNPDALADLTFSDSRRAVIWISLKPYDLNALCSSRYGLLREAVAINDRGQILAIAEDKAEEEHLVLLTPSDSPRK